MVVVIILVILFLIGAVVFVTKQNKPSPTPHVGGGGYSGIPDTYQHISHIDNGEVPVDKENPRHDG